MSILTQKTQFLLLAMLLATIGCVPLTATTEEQSIDKEDNSSIVTFSDDENDENEILEAQKPTKTGHQEPLVDNFPVHERYDYAGILNEDLSLKSTKNVVFPIVYPFYLTLGLIITLKAIYDIYKNEYDHFYEEEHFLVKDYKIITRKFGRLIIGVGILFSAFAGQFWRYYFSGKLDAWFCYNWGGKVYPFALSVCNIRSLCLLSFSILFFCKKRPIEGVVSIFLYFANNIHAEFKRQDEWHGLVTRPCSVGLVKLISNED